MSDRWRGALCGIGAAALFGLSAPIAKLLVPQAGPVVLASLLYLGAASALWIVRVSTATQPQTEAPLRRTDLPWLGGIILTGGMLGPVLMLVGLARVSALTGSLLLNLEAPFTMLLAVALFGEHIGKRATVAAILICIGAALLGDYGRLSAETLGVLCICAACIAWAVDNNLTQRLSLRDPRAIVCWKASAAGLGNLLITYALGEPLPQMRVVAAALVLGALSYGVSIVLDTYALRLIGAAREAAFFATAPFFGAATATLIFGDPVGSRQAAAALLMLGGVVALFLERHSHAHEHRPLTHEHAHTHDEHHQHVHDERVDGAHSHPHTHAPTRHVHPHVSDLHHRHDH
ncbi:MAG: EamA family transporter [Deltaproteobacteria bacterium]|nr:EamA family transporter [Deltaproteobacteria bacterium]